jgi:hypothetical protein
VRCAGPLVLPGSSFITRLNAAHDRAEGRF